MNTTTQSFSMKAARILSGLAVALAASSSPAAAAQPLVDSVVCGRTEFAIRAQRERAGVPGLSAPRIYFDRRADGNLNATYLRWPGRNDLFESPFSVSDGGQFPGVAEQLGISCNGGEPQLLARVRHWGDTEPGSRPRDYEFVDYDRDGVVSEDLILSDETGDGEWLAGEFALFGRGRNPNGRGADVLAVREVFNFNVVVDPTLDVRLTEVEGFNDGDPVRPTGRAQFGELGSSEMILDELMVLVPDDEALDGIMARWNAELVDRSPLDRQGVSAALLRFDPSVLATVDTSGLAEDLLRIEADHRGTLSLSSERLAQLFALAAAEILEHGSVVSPNVLNRLPSINSGTTDEGDLLSGDVLTPLDAFKLSFLSDSQDTIQTGVARAWQVMDATVGFSEKVKIMLVDCGYSENPDLPFGTILRETKWGDVSALPNSSGGESPFHGTASATTAFGVPDNGYGTAGPAGLVAKPILVGCYKDAYKTLRRALDHVAEHRPSVVDVAPTCPHYAFRAAAEEIKDVYFGGMSDYGALVVASADNDGQNVDATISGNETPTILPCESKHVMCVGGISGNGIHDDGSNYGSTTGNKTVEIYGPWCTYARIDDLDPLNLNMKRVCGTSESAPFVAGVAALVKSANPSLTTTELREILYATAHTGAPFMAPVPGGYDRRINAFGAVVAALGITIDPPTLTIVEPKPGKHISKFDALDVKAVASDTFGRPLAITWSSSIDGHLGTSASGMLAPFQLTSGSHTIRVRATDFRGEVVEKTVAVTVGAVPQVQILAPQQGGEFYAAEPLALIAHSFDPDSNGPVLDSDVNWTVVKGAVLIWEGTGHITEVPADTLSAGFYDVYVSAKDGEGTVLDHVGVTVQPLPPGLKPPKATILKPASDLDLDSLNGVSLPIVFEGQGTDTNDGAVSGYRFRWTALSHKGTKKVLCEGSSVPKDGNGGIVLPKDCTTFTATLGPDQSETITTWVVTLEVFDSDAMRGQATRSVTISTIAK